MNVIPTDYPCVTVRPWTPNANGPGEYKAADVEVRKAPGDPIEAEVMAVKTVHGTAFEDQPKPLRERIIITMNEAL